MFRAAGVRPLVVLACLLVCQESILFAQSAEPVRIEVQPGTDSTSVQGSLRGRQQMNYVLAVQQNQRLTLKLASHPAQMLKLELRDPQNTQVSMQGSGRHQWTAVIAEAGDYEIWVLRASSSAGVSSYRLTVTIR